MDDYSFFGPSLPHEVRAMIPLLTKIEQPQFRKAIQIAVEHLKGVPISDQQFHQISKVVNLSKQTFALVFTGVYYILRAAVRSKAKTEVVQSLLTELRIPEPFIADLVKVVQTSRATLESAVAARRLRLPRIENLYWRVDITISTTSLSRVMKPTISFSVTLDDGTIKTFEVPTQQFHLLRYNIAKLLKDIDELEKHPILKVDV